MGAMVAEAFQWKFNEKERESIDLGGAFVQWLIKSTTIPRISFPVEIAIQIAIRFIIEIATIARCF